MYLESLTPEVVSAQGTSFKEAFETSKEAFERGGITADASTKVTRVILMASDGEDHEPGAAEMAETLAKDGIKIFTLAYGTQSGGPIPIRDANGFLVSYKKDKSGQTVTTTVHGDELKKLAQAGKGSFYHAVFGGRHLESLVDDFTKLEKSDFESMMATQYEERFQFPLFLAILLALIELFLGERTQSFRLWNGRFEVPLGSVSFWFCSILFFEMLMSFAPQAVAEVEKSPAVIHEHKNTQSETPLQALQLNKKGAELLKEQNYSEAFQYFTKALALDPYSVEIQLNMGIALEGMEQGEKALQIDKGALEMAQTPEMKYYALFNVAQLFGKQKKIDEALHYYQEALKINPLSKEAKVNIELLIKDQQNQSKGGKGSKDPKDQKGDQKSEGENSEQNKDKEKDKDSPKKYAPQKPQPQKFKGDKLNESDVSKILGELKNQEQRIRKEYYKKEAKEKGRDKDW
jgi:tetratricopeptide (TPR) repeat protein